MMPGKLCGYAGRLSSEYDPDLHHIASSRRLSSDKKYIIAMEIRTLEEKKYPDFLTLYNQTFPEDQRRSYRDEQHLARFIKGKGGKFSAYAAVDGDLFLGFLSYWKFQGYIYIEHFAVRPEHRGRNIGSRLLQHLMKEQGENVLVEVEPAGTDKTADDRIRFYERNGFRTRKEINYVQPPYSPEKAPVKLLLMTHGDVKLTGKDDMREMLQDVYNVNYGG